MPNITKVIGKLFQTLLFLAVGLVFLFFIGWGLSKIWWWWTYVYSLPDSYGAKQINGWVIDADTQQPLEGAIVIALWELERSYNWENPIPTGHMQVTEVLTDTEGRYIIPAWGPRERPKGAWMNNNDPLLVFYKEGYDYRKERNDPAGTMSDDRHDEIHNSKWGGRTVELKKFPGLDTKKGLKAYYDRMRRSQGIFASLLDSFFGADNCDWQKIPQMIIKYDRLHQILVKNLDQRRSYNIPKISRLIVRGDCGSEEDFIRRYTRINRE